MPIKSNSRICCKKYKTDLFLVNSMRQAVCLYEENLLALLLAARLVNNLGIPSDSEPGVQAAFRASPFVEG